MGSSFYTILYTQYNIFQYQDQDNVANVECKTCDANTYQADKRSAAVNHDNEADCLDCPGKMYSEPGQQGCTPCAAGKAADDTTKSSGICTDCQAGQVSSSATDLKCEKCKVGYYQNEEGLPSCIKCIPGRYQDEKGEDKCEQCQHGQHDTGKWPTRNVSTVCEGCEYIYTTTIVSSHMYISSITHFTHL